MSEKIIPGNGCAIHQPAENGIRVMVPPFVNSGEKIVVRTEDATYVERAK